MKGQYMEPIFDFDNVDQDQILLGIDEDRSDGFERSSRSATYPGGNGNGNGYASASRGGFSAQHSFSYSSSPEFILSHTQSFPPTYPFMSNEALLSQQWGNMPQAGPAHHSFTEGFTPMTDVNMTDFNAGDWNETSTFTTSPVADHSFSSPVDIPSNATFNDQFAYLSPGDTIDASYLSPHSWNSSYFAQSQATSVTESVASFDTAVEEPFPILSTVDEEPASFTVQPAHNTGDVLGTSPFSMILQYQPSTGTNRLAPTTISGGRRPRGRTGPLNDIQKKQTARMRQIKACDSCRQRKAKCDPGVPCRQCINYHKCDLIHHPCRGRQLEDIADKILRGQMFPRKRHLGKDFGATFRIWPRSEFTVNLTLGFGQPFKWSAQIVAPLNCTKMPKELVHEHVVYKWPDDHLFEAQRTVEKNWVFPALLTKTDDLKSAIDEHLSKLIDDPANFVHFPLYKSPLEVLTHIWTFYLQLGESGEEKGAKDLLRQAFKLLNLIHIGGDTRLSPNDGSRWVISQFFGPNTSEKQVIPCFIRGQIGEVYSQLAEQYMKTILKKLEVECLNKNCRRFPLIVSTFMVLFMAVESIQYHIHKDTFHFEEDGSQKPRALVEDKIEGMVELLEFYKNCFAECHKDRILACNGECTAAESFANGRGSSGTMFQAGEQTLARLREGYQRSKEYLTTRSRESLETNGGDITVFFDKLVAQLLLLESRDAF